MTNIIEMSSDSSISQDEGSSISLCLPNTDETVVFKDTLSIKVVAEGQYTSKYKLLLVFMYNQCTHFGENGILYIA